MAVGRRPIRWEVGEPVGEVGNHRWQIADAATGDVLFVHVAFLQEREIPAFLIEHNDSPAETPLEDGIRVFVALDRKADAVQLFQSQFKTSLAGPFTGALLASSGKNNLGIVTDVTGEESINWQRTEVDRLAGVDVGEMPPRESLVPANGCEHCQTPRQPDAAYCPNCGENYPLAE